MMERSTLRFITKPVESRGDACAAVRRTAGGCTSLIYDDIKAGKSGDRAKFDRVVNLCAKDAM